MRIDPAIHVNRPDLVRLDAEEVPLVDLWPAIRRELSSATEIVVLGGFYSVEPVLSLLEGVPKRGRRGCRVRIAVGLDSAAATTRTWEDMRGVERRVRAMGFRTPEVSVVPGRPVHFHTKLFRVVKSTWPVWYVGSANPGSARHELMVRLVGRHDALSAYVEAVFARARPVASNPPEGEIRTLRDFFLSGSLCHKPPTQRLFTFDAYRMTPEDRDRLSEILAGEAGVEHARPRTEGFGFGLRSALGIEEEQSAKPVHVRRSCVETVFGQWMPAPYVDDVRSRIRDEEEARLARLEAVLEALLAPSGFARAREALAAHVASVDRLLRENSVEARPARDRDAAFERFLSSRAANLSDPARRRRLARSLTIAEMPDFGEDPKAMDEFEASFFEDVAYRSGSPSGRSARVVRSLAEKLDLSGDEMPEEVRALLETSLRAGPWEDGDWSGAHDA